MALNKHVGSSLESLLDERSIKEEVDLLTRKKILAQDLRRCMESHQVTQSALATRMKTSRTVVHRLLDPADTSVTLATIAKASAALGMDFVIKLVEPAAKELTQKRKPMRQVRE
jgi:transcriptional regulator with XRE-family HTH domain